MVALFAIGVITGTVLSFEMGLLWPNFTGTFRSVFGLGFAIEGLSFFMEAIFIGIYVYGWGRFSARWHLLSGIAIVITGFFGSWMYLAIWICRKRLPESVWFYRALILAGPAAVAALISGWIVTEVGRQPWVVYRVMPTASAVTDAREIPVSYGGWRVRACLCRTCLGAAAPGASPARVARRTRTARSVAGGLARCFSRRSRWFSC
jgi:cytochrome bd-type quinol oxidase subunit 1